MKINECSCGCGKASDKCMEKGESDINYMFFGNLETMKRMIDELMNMDPMQVDKILKDGHSWAVDHIASSADDVQEVYNFLTNNTSSIHREKDVFAEPDMLVKTFESYVNEVSSKKWKGIEDNLRRRNMNQFADKVSVHNKKYGTDKIDEIKFVGVPVSGYDREEITLSVSELELRQKSGSTFKLVGHDSKWGTVVINGTCKMDGSIKMFESDRMPLLVADRKNAKLLIKLLSDEKVTSESLVDWRLFTSGYVSFDDAYTM